MLRRAPMRTIVALGLVAAALTLSGCVSAATDGPGLRLAAADETIPPPPPELFAPADGRADAPSQVSGYVLAESAPTPSPSAPGPITPHAAPVLDARQLARASAKPGASQSARVDIAEKKTRTPPRGQDHAIRIAQAFSVHPKPMPAPTNGHSAGPGKVQRVKLATARPGRWTRGDGGASERRRERLWTAGSLTRRISDFLLHFVHLDGSHGYKA